MSSEKCRPDSGRQGSVDDCAEGQLLSCSSTKKWGGDGIADGQVPLPPDASRWVEDAFTGSFTHAPLTNTIPEYFVRSQLDILEKIQMEFNSNGRSLPASVSTARPGAQPTEDKEEQYLPTVTLTSAKGHGLDIQGQDDECKEIPLSDQDVILFQQQIWEEIQRENEVNKQQAFAVHKRESSSSEDFGRPKPLSRCCSGASQAADDEVEFHSSNRAGIKLQESRRSPKATCKQNRAEDDDSNRIVELSNGKTIGP